MGHILVLREREEGADQREREPTKKREMPSAPRRASRVCEGELRLLQCLVGAPTTDARILFLSLANAETMEAWRERVPRYSKVRMRLRGNLFVPHV